MELTTDFKKQIEDAFTYRGHVTVALKDGKTAEGYLFNRCYEQHPSSKDVGYFVELFLKGSGDKARFLMQDIASIALTGVDEAAGKSYQDWIKKKEKSLTHN
ncbi:MAG TPA: hypothetical protein VFX30_11225 [bacterium]|nr:hypothetical protein [bacterium]